MDRGKGSEQFITELIVTKDTRACRDDLTLQQSWCAAAYVARPTLEEDLASARDRSCAGARPCHSNLLPQPLGLPYAWLEGCVRWSYEGVGTGDEIRDTGGGEGRCLHGVIGAHRSIVSILLEASASDGLNGSRSIGSRSLN